MATDLSLPALRRDPWNKGRLIGQKRPLKPKDVWTIRVRLQMEGRRRDLAMFNLAIDSKLRGCDLVQLRIDDVFAGGRVRDGATVIQKKTGRPVQVRDYRADPCCCRRVACGSRCSRGPISVPKRLRGKPHLSTRQYARIVHRWADRAGPIARHLARTLCAERNRHRFTRRPAICEPSSYCSATRSWRAPCVISGSRLMTRSASRSSTRLRSCESQGAVHPR
jgi:hypothetical protein